MQRKLNGSKHPATLYAMHTLATSYYNSGRHDEALRLRKEVLELREKVIGPKHNNTLNSMHNLAISLQETGQWEEALRIREKLLPVRREVNGPAHPYTRLLIEDLVESYFIAGRWENALQLMSGWTALSPSDTVGTLKVCALQAWIGKDSAHVETCRELLTKAADTQDPATADRVAKGYCLVPSSDPRLLEISLTLARRAVELGKNDSDRPWYQMGLGIAEYRKGNFLAADQALHTALETLDAIGPSMGDSEKTVPMINATVSIYQALSLYRQGRVAEFIEAFAAAEAQIKPLPVQGQPQKGFSLHNDLICWLAYKEAKAMLQPQTR